MAVPQTREQPDHLLEFVDQALFLGLRATGQAAAMQMVWVYDHPVDWDGLRRFHRNFGYGMAGRLIEPSPLPFGRHRWVAALGPAAPLEVVADPRPRSELSDWLDEHSQRPIDPEHGPAWHMGVLPMTDGSTAVSLVGSHCIGDGGAALLAVFEAVAGTRRDLGYPPPRSRARRAAIIEDLRQTARDAPQLGRTLVTAAKFLNRRRKESAGASTQKSAQRHPDTPVVVPVVSAFVPLEDWDARAAELGGNSHSMLAGVAARLAILQGRELADDGTVGLIVPINDRTLEDTRANAVTLAYVRADPTYVTKDLSETRTAIRQALQVMREGPDTTFELLPLTPFIPKVAVRQSADLAFGFTAQPVSCSNLGDLPLDVARPDGTVADRVMLRGIDQHVTRRVLEERQGLLTVVGARIDGKVTLTIVAYQPGSENTKAALRERVTAALAEFGLGGEVL
jgi:hypothetical protein